MLLNKTYIDDVEFLRTNHVKLAIYQEMQTCDEEDESGLLLAIKIIDRIRKEK